MMNDPTTVKHRANAAYAIATGMEAAANQGVPDTVIADEMLKITLGLIGAANGGPAGIPDALERIAQEIRNNINEERKIN